MARKEAERLLEAKSRELYEANQGLIAARDELEQRVKDRTVELANALIGAQRASDAKSTFLAHMSHELRTPLTAILGYTSDLREASPSVELDTVHRNASHLLELINEVLDLAKVESGTLEMRPAATDVHGLLHDLVATIEPQAQAKSLAFQLHIAPDVPDEAPLDAVRVRQVLLNLLGNALKFTERGHLRLQARRPAPHRLAIEVLDTGRGIPEDALGTLFEPFVQVSGRPAQGTGLGLAISARLVRAMGGTLEVQSEVGRGSCFRVELPLAAAEAPRASVTPTASLPESPLAGRRILLADDAPDSLRLLERWCRRAGAETHAVHDGEQALAALADPFDLVLMDMQMPVLDGLEATRRLRATGDDTPVVALTANTMAEDQLACLRAGCDGFLAKPVERERLLRTVLHHLAHRAGR